MPAVGKVAPSRAGKRQVLCYVDSDTLTAVKAAASKLRETLQQFLARALSRELAHRGAAISVTCERHHLFVRVEKAAQPRVAASLPPSRAGRRTIAGWYDRREVDAATDFASETGTSLQEIASRGLARALRDAEAARQAATALRVETSNA